MAYTPIGISPAINVSVYTPYGDSPTNKVNSYTTIGSWIVKDLKS